MCGISGILNFNSKPVNYKDLYKMGSSIKHRGPDDFGIYKSNNIGFSHNRLSILDLSTKGKQPMQSLNGRWVISYNGEIYNFLELKEELKLNYKFISNTDTEVILNAFDYWGLEAVNKFNGIFAFAILDQKNNKTFLVRDRYGVKPLYYEIENERLLFSSEIKAILKVRKSSNKIDKRVLIEYLTFQNIFSNNNLINNIKLLPPGNIIEYQNDKIKIFEYWDYKFNESLEKNKSKNYEEEFINLFSQSIKRQTISDVEIGSHLSSGLDSTTIAYLAKKKLGSINTFTCGFNVNDISGIEVGFDESHISKKIAKKLKTNHDEYIISFGDMEKSFAKLCYHLEEPRLGQCYPNFFLSKLVSKKNKVVLSGIGGDELFGGYPWRYFIPNEKLSYKKYIQNYYKFWQRLMPNSQLRNLLGPIKSEFNNFQTIEIFEKVLSKIGKPENKQQYFNASLYFEAKTFLSSLLIIEDKLNMAHSVECRVPFLDNDLVDFSLNCPTNLKINLNSLANIKINENLTKKKERYYYMTNEGKMILRKAFNNKIPQYVLKQHKQGFSGPDSSWFKNQSLNYVNKVLMNKNARINEYLDRIEIKKIIDQHISGNSNKRLAIWSMLYFENFLNKFIN